MVDRRIETGGAAPGQGRLGVGVAGLAAGFRLKGESGWPPNDIRDAGRASRCR
jgi:hypothetical protein